MKCRYYHGERKNPFDLTDGSRSGDPRSMYWSAEMFVCEYIGRSMNDITDGIRGYPCQVWPDFIRRSKVDLRERGLAFEIDFQNGKYGFGEHDANWYSYFCGPRVRWQEQPCDVPASAIDLSGYVLSDYTDICGCSDGKLIRFGPIVDVTYRGISKTECDEGVPVFEAENLKGDRLHVISPGYRFRYGDFKVSLKHIDSDGSEMPVHVYDKRLHVALARLVLDEDAPAICVGERLRLPTNAEADNEMRWYRLYGRT